MAAQNDRERVIRDFKNHTDNRVKEVARRTGLPFATVNKYINQHLEEVRKNIGKRS